jgi:hypothetical protein
LAIPGIGVTYEVDFDTFKELLRYLQIKNRFRAYYRISGFKPSSEYINFLSPRPKAKMPKKIMKLVLRRIKGCYRTMLNNIIF